MDEVEQVASRALSIPPPQMHPEFNAADADITIQSSDGVLFRLHRKNLEVHAGAFPGSEFVNNPDEVTSLTETSAVLEVLFKFMYPRRQPDLEDLQSEIMLFLAEAVEKYEVFAAMKVCETQLRQLLPMHSAEILAHAIRHDYPKLIEAAMPNLSRRPLTEVLSKLPAEYMLPWCRYYEAWQGAFRQAIVKVGQEQGACRKGCDTRGCAERSISQIIKWENIQSFSKLEESLREASEGDRSCDNCGYGPSCNGNFVDAARYVREGINAIPPFIEFLRD